jgi:hypothetical protein
MQDAGNDAAMGGCSDGSGAGGPRPPAMAAAADADPDTALRLALWQQAPSKEVREPGRKRLQSYALLWKGTSHAADRRAPAPRARHRVAAATAASPCSAHPPISPASASWPLPSHYQVLDTLCAAGGGALFRAAQAALASALLASPLLCTLRPRALYLGRLLKQLVEALDAQDRAQGAGAGCSGELLEELAELHAEVLLSPPVRGSPLRARQGPAPAVMQGLHYRGEHKNNAATGARRSAGRLTPGCLHHLLS